MVGVDWGRIMPLRETAEIMDITKDQLVVDLNAIGLEPGDSVLVHTSLRQVGRVEGGPEAFIQALQEAVGPTGTVLFPTLTGRREDSPQNPPAFDARSTVTTMVGLVPETARRMPNALRSTHPTHSVAAIGARAEWFSTGHEACLSPCGAGSPFHKLSESGGKILLVGCSHTSNTSLHMVEELANLPYHLQPGRARFSVTDRAGNPVMVDTAFHSWDHKRDFEAVRTLLAGTAAQQQGWVGSADALLVDSGAMTRILVDVLDRDPEFLLAK